MDIFDSTNYREFLKSFIAKDGKAWGLKSALAEAAGCQRSFFSQVLSGNADLSLEHASGIAHFMKFDEDRTDQFLDLVAVEKAQGVHLKDRLQKRILKRAKENTSLTKRFSAPAISTSEHQQNYYSSWYVSVIHILCGIPEFQTCAAIAEKLSLPEKVVDHCLQELERMELITREGDRLENAKGSIHLPKESPVAVAHHFHWRQQSNLDLQMRSMDSIHYTALQSISKKDIPKLRRLILEFLEESRNLVVKSGKEEVVCFTCDLFAVGK